MRSLEGQTALVAGGGGALGRAIALALSARGVRVIVTGRDEKALGETVGEIAHGGGKARHLAGDPDDVAHLAAAADRAIELFGRLDLVVDAGGDPMAATCTFEAAWPRLRSPGRMLVVRTSAPSTETPAELLASIRERAASGAAKRITCNAVLALSAEDIDATDDVASDVASLVVYLCGRAADGITGQAISVAAVA
jgi:NAD(P)-dependent dehydrogenase (short-subunit alcohol dehydrogenase family)